MDWVRVLAYVTGTVNQELLARNEYLAAENRILKAQLKARLKLSDVERAMLGEIGHRLGRKALAEVATVAKPDTSATTRGRVTSCCSLVTRLPAPSSSLFNAASDWAGSCAITIGRRHEWVGLL